MIILYFRMCYSSLYILLEGTRAVASGGILYVVITTYPLTLENTSIKVHHQQNPYFLKPFSDVTCISLKPTPAYTWKHSFREALWGRSSILFLCFWFKCLQEQKGSDVKGCIQNCEMRLRTLGFSSLYLIGDFDMSSGIVGPKHWNHLASRMYGFWIFLTPLTIPQSPRTQTLDLFSVCT